MDDTRPRRVLLATSTSLALMVAALTPADTEVVVLPPRHPYPAAPDIPPPDLSPRSLVVDITDALAHLRRPKREGNRAERRARGRR